MQPKEQHAERQEKMEQAQRELEKFQAVFFLAGMQPATFKPIPNGYCSLECCSSLPWYEVETMKGTIIIGWRRRVINIDWSKTGNTIDPVKWGNDLVFPTRGDTYIHAYGYSKAVEYINVLSTIWPHTEYREAWLQREVERKIRDAAYEAKRKTI